MVISPSRIFYFLLLLSGTGPSHPGCASLSSALAGGYSAVLLPWSLAERKKKYLLSIVFIVLFAWLLFCLERINVLPKGPHDQVIFLWDIPIYPCIFFWKVERYLVIPWRFYIIYETCKKMNYFEIKVSWCLIKFMG